MHRDRTIILDCERMRYHHTGLYHFCFQLGQALLLARQENESIMFYADKHNKDVFGATQRYMMQQPTHKLLRPSVKGCHVWHETHQDSMYQPSSKRIPVVLTIHDLNFLKGNLKTLDKQRTYLKRLQQKVNDANHLVTISKYVLNDLEQHIDTKGKPISVIYNGCNIKLLATLSKPVCAPVQPFLFAIGLVTAKKNFHVLPRLLVGNELELYIAGVTQDKQYHKRILEEAQSLGVSNRVHLIGGISENDKQWYFKHCTAFVHPSIAEGFGLPVIEAMAFGKPVFLSKETSLPEIGGEHAYYFSSFETNVMLQDLHNGLQNYQKSDAHRDSIMQHARKFCWQKAAQEYMGIYRTLY